MLTTEFVVTSLSVVALTGTLLVRAVAMNRTGIAATLLVFLSLTVSFVALETWCRLYLARSDFFAFTLSHRLWVERHWGPENSLGYRDAEPTLDGSKPIWAVVGDSFAAGTGIDRREDRFADLIRRRAGEHFEVVLIAQQGWNTVQELAALERFPRTPQRVLLSYFVNDIEWAAEMEGIHRPEPVAVPPAIVDKVLHRSHALNFIYWQLVRAVPTDNAESYGSYLRRAFESPEASARHRQEVERLVAWCRERRIELGVVLIPALSAIEETAPLLSVVSSWFASSDVPAIDLSKRLAGRDPRTLVVSPRDGHANAALNLEIADFAFELFPPDGYPH